MKVTNNIVELIGETPIVKLNRSTEKDSADIYVKLEFMNPGSSIKDRIAAAMIEAAEKEGILKPGDTIIEPTSGNTGIGLAMVSAAKGYKLIVTMPDSMSIERRNLHKAYGAEVILTPGEKGMNGAISKAEELQQTKGYFMPQQFKNAANPRIHEQTTGKEIIAQMKDGLDAFVAGIGTGGTITGVGKVLRDEFDKVKIYAVEPEDSAVLSGEAAGPHKIQGIGAGFVPEILNTKIYDEVIQISNNEAFEAARMVAKNEGILCGISSGAAIVAAQKVAKELGKGKNVLAILPDSGERYLSTALFDFN